MILHNAITFLYVDFCSSVGSIRRVLATYELKLLYKVPKPRTIQSDFKASVVDSAKSSEE